MKNEIELKEELLLLEAKYISIVNSGETSKHKYWYQDSHKSKSREICSAMSKCKKELNDIHKLKSMIDEVKILRSLKSTMEDVIKISGSLASTYINDYMDLCEQIKFIENKLNIFMEKSN